MIRSVAEQFTSEIQETIASRFGFDASKLKALDGYES